MPPPTNSSVFNDDCSSKVFPALEGLYLEKCVLLESADFLRIFNCYTTLETLDLSGSGIVTIPACIKRFVALVEFEFYDCKPLREIQAFPPISDNIVDARGCMSLELYNKCWLPELLIARPVGSRIGVPINNITPFREAYQNGPTSFLDEGLREKDFDMVVSGNKVPDWFSYRKDQFSNSHSCEIDIDVPLDLDGKISTIVFAVVSDTVIDDSSICIYVIRDDVQIFHTALGDLGSDCVRLYFYVPEPCELEEYNGHLRVIFATKSNYDYEDDDDIPPGCGVIRSCGVHLVRRREEKAKDSIGGTQVTKRPRNDDDKDDDNLESNCYPQQKRHSSTAGIRISDTEAEEL